MDGLCAKGHKSKNTTFQGTQKTLFYNLIGRSNTFNV